MYLFLLDRLKFRLVAHHQNRAKTLGWSVRVFPCLFYAKCIIQCRSRYVSLLVNGIKRISYDISMGILHARALGSPMIYVRYQTTIFWYKNKNFGYWFFFTKDMFANTLKSHRKIKIQVCLFDQQSAWRLW